jgi:hypothetical protein
MPVSCRDHFDFIVEWNESWDVCVLPCESKFGIFGGPPTIELSVSSFGKVKEAPRLDFGNVFTFQFLDFGGNKYFMLLVKEHSPDENRTVLRHADFIWRDGFIKFHQ